MLIHLQIRNFILIKEISVDLSNSFNVFTGETGAGKSLFVDALNFVSGQRSSASVVGKYGNSAYVEAIFSFSKDAPIMRELEAKGFIEDTFDNVIFSREMNQDGRNIIRINSKAVNLTTMREFLELALDIHSQHETQYLLNERNHRLLLDTYMNNDSLLENYQSLYKQYQSKIKELESFEKSVYNEDEIEFAKFQIQEIEGLNPSVEDYNALVARLNELENFEKVKSRYNHIETILNEEPNVLGVMYDLLNHFENIDDLKQSYTDMYYQVEDITHELIRRNNALLFDEYEFSTLQDRMGLYFKHIRKHGSIEAFMEHYDGLIRFIENIDTFEERLIDYKNEINRLYEEVEIAASLIHDARKAAALALEKEVVRELHDLLLENAVFKIEVEKTNLNNYGSDTITFKVSMNKGMRLESLSKVASGGELSRVMLGLKVIFSTVQGISLLVFDEIDTGVSGKVALRIGEKMRRIAEDIQVISITHLPTVAASATHHFLISKQDGVDETTTSVSLLSDEARISQLALMMSGVVSDESMNAAEKLLDERKRSI